MTEPRPLSGRIDDLPSLPVKEYGEGIGKRVIFGPGRFWEEYTVRFFTTAPGKKTPFHAHDWPHYVLVVEGRGSQRGRRVVVGVVVMVSIDWLWV